MLNKQVFFTGVHKAEFIENEIGKPNGNQALVKTEYSVISGGTERAVLTAENNTAGIFPTPVGYCGVGRIIEIGEDVENLKVGDRVLVYHAGHSQYNICPESDLTKIEDDSIDSLEAAFVVIASMGLGGVRKLEVELGESAMVMGLGLLGMFSVQFLRVSGAYPVIAVDLSEGRRELALKLGADFAFDPTDKDFVEKVRAATNGRGVNACVEVTGVAAALNSALDCASWMGRISLLGCTRVSDSSIDYYTQIHRPGIKLLGAHNFVRPKVESYPHHWTHHDDCRAILNMISGKRIQVKPIATRIADPKDAPEIYNELCDNKDFPLGTVFDWRNVE
ncbi:MAG: zinc-binding alcohol dehydrogenase [Oscillospiraceae bacterium]|nr:zinc-binding alcohol dehydrogenase [Oscillospiraceae bacterium]